MIDALAQTIDRLEGRAGSLSEQDTKRILITPLLQALGWNIFDIDEVRNEYRYKPGHNPVDYALFEARSPCLFIEAKALGHGLDDVKWVNQAISYAAVAGVEWCVLTNGDEYRLYNAVGRADAEGKLFRTVRISAPDGRRFALDTLGLLSKERMAEKRLNLLWKTHFVDRQVRAALDALFETRDDALVRLIGKRTTDLTAGDIRQSLQRADVAIRFPQVIESAKPVVEAPPQQHLSDHPVPVIKVRKGDHAGLPDLIDAGLFHPPHEIVARWRKQDFTAAVEADGTVTFNGERYSSLSVAAGFARNIANGPPTDGRTHWQTNGWTFWKCRDPATGALVPLDHLRQRFRASSEPGERGQHDNAG